MLLLYNWHICWGGYNNVLLLFGRTDIYVEVDAAVGAVNGTNGVFVAARVQNGGCDAYEAKGIFFFLFPQTKRYIVSYDLGMCVSPEFVLDGSCS